MKQYEMPLYGAGAVINPPIEALESWHWETGAVYRPQSKFSCYAIKDDGIYAELWSAEENPRSRHIKRDRPVYEDSCLEIFLQPQLADARYINLEANELGTLWSAIGEQRGGRSFLKALTASAVITGRTDELSWQHFGRGGWGVQFIIPLELLQALYGSGFNFYDGQVMRGNFYKCGDKTKIPHWGAWSPVTTNPPGFHNPDCFGEIILKEVNA
ncbi:MAG: carbohydrate-binding family 9-like protein [Oscillospiraceae bacterium]|jgi:hypothetical protein|nr:carbohydrate-binding family 9-like protein [Oscillospiraceae bacterium]